MRDILLFTALLISVEYGSSACPNGWRANQTSCYLYFHEHYNFFEAKVACDIVDSHLVEIDTPDENAFIVDLAKENRSPNVWMGMEDFVIEGEYQWTSSQMRPEYFNWIDGDPNNWKYQEDCVAMEVSSGGWFDFDCEHKYPFVCETPAPEGEIIG